MSRKWLGIIVAIGGGVTLLSPVYESAQVSTVGQKAAYNVCWELHGFNFIGRWSCESFYSNNIMATAMSCAFNTEPQKICLEVKRLATENKGTAR